MTRDEIIRIAVDAQFFATSQITRVHESYICALERFAALVAAAERKACAKVCEQCKIITPEGQHDQFYNQGATHCADAIRARGEKGQS